MIKHIFKMLWIQRSKYIGIFTVQSLVFVIFIVLFISIFKKVEMYSSPGNLKTENVVRVIFKFIPGMAWNSVQSEQTHIKMESLMENIAAMPNVKNVCRAEYLAPYQTSFRDYKYSTIESNGQNIKFSRKIADKNSAFIYEPLLVKGEWLTDGTLVDGTWPAVITQAMADTLNWSEPIGKKIEALNNYKKLPIPLTVVGVISGAKEHLFEESPAAIIVSPKQDFSVNGWQFHGEYNVEITDDFETLAITFNKEFNKMVGLNNLYTSVLRIDKYKNHEIVKNTITEVFMTVPALFFLIFTFIGTFGLFWLYSQKRTREFALRRAIGSSQNKLLLLLVGESVTLTILASIPATLLALIVYGFEIYMCYALLVSLLIMTTFSLFSALYPALKVSRLPIYEVLKSE